MHRFASADRFLGRLGRASIVGWSLVGVLLVGAADYFTGAEVSMSLFYLGPLALAAWYAGRRAGIGIAAMSCMAWYGVQLATGYPYSHPAIPVWNALIRFGFFFVTGSLLGALRASLLEQRYLARTDVLTGLHGRRAFEDRLAHDLAMAQRHGSSLTLAYLDLDNFKDVNDTRGHAAGDGLLRTTGHLLTTALRKTDTAARLGGDEFALLLPETDAQGAKKVVEALARDLHAAFSAGGLDVTCSIGVVTFIEPGLSATEALAAADGLMYEVKRGSKAGTAFRVVDGVARQRADEGAPATRTG